MCTWEPLPPSDLFKLDFLSIGKWAVGLLLRDLLVSVGFGSTVFCVFLQGDGIKNCRCF